MFCLHWLVYSQQTLFLKHLFYVAFKCSNHSTISFRIKSQPNWANPATLQQICRFIKQRFSAGQSFNFLVLKKTTPFSWNTFQPTTKADWADGQKGIPPFGWWVTSLPRSVVSSMFCFCGTKLGRKCFLDFVPHPRSVGSVLIVHLINIGLSVVSHRSKRNDTKSVKWGKFYRNIRLICQSVGSAYRSKTSEQNDHKLGTDWAENYLLPGQWKKAP